MHTVKVAGSEAAEKLIASFRQEASTDKAVKAAEGQAAGRRRRGGQRPAGDRPAEEAGGPPGAEGSGRGGALRHEAPWERPAEVARIMPTDLEEDLRQTMAGPDLTTCVEDQSEQPTTAYAENRRRAPRRCTGLRRRPQSSSRQWGGIIQKQPPSSASTSRTACVAGGARARRPHWSPWPARPSSLGPFRAGRAGVLLPAGGAREHGGQGGVGEICWGHPSIPGTGIFRWGGWGP